MERATPGHQHTMPGEKSARALLLACLFSSMQACAASVEPVAPRHEQAPAAENRLPPSVAAKRAAPPAPAIEAPRPLPLTGCDGGGCAGTDGNRFHGGAANTYLDQNGRPCNRSGTWMQCF